MAGVPGVHDLGAGLVGVGPREGARGKAVWCGAPWMEASCAGPSWRPEVAVRRVEEEEQTAKEGDVCEEEPGCSGWTPRL